MKIDPSIQFTFEGRVVVTPDNIKDGATVRRGPDWKWGDQDNGREGVIDTVNKATDGWISVNWGGFGSANCNNYRIGAEDSYDLVYSQMV